MNIGKAIKLCRVQKNLSQAALAKKSNISPAYLSLVEHGKRDLTFSSLEQIAKVLDIPVFMLVFLAEDRSELKNIDIQLIEKTSSFFLNLMS